MKRHNHIQALLDEWQSALNRIKELERTVEEQETTRHNLAIERNHAVNTLQDALEKIEVLKKANNTTVNITSSGCLPLGARPIAGEEAEQYKAFQGILRLHKNGLRFTIGFTHTNSVFPLFCPKVFSTEGSCAQDLPGVLAILKKAIEREIADKSSYADQIASLQKILGDK